LELSDRDTGGDNSWKDALRDEVAARGGVTTEVPKTENVEAAPATTPESTSDVVAEPEVKASEESPSSAQPVPASDVPTTSAVEALAKRGFKVEDEKLATEYLRLESEFAAMKRAEKTKAQPAIETQPEKPQAAPEPVPVAKPVESTKAVAPEPPADTTKLPADVEQTIAQHVERDSVCLDLVKEFAGIKDEIARIGEIDRFGRPTNGLLAEKATEIAELKRQLLPPSDHLKKYGIEVPELDPITKERIKAEIAILSTELREGIDYAKGLSERMREVASAHEAREKQYRDHFASEYQTKFEAEQQVSDIEARTVSFGKLWTTQVEAAFKSHSVPEDLKKRVEKAVKREAYAYKVSNDIEFDAATLAAFLDKTIKAELEDIDTIHRFKSKEYAETKRELTKVATPGPAGKDAVAPPAPNSNADWRDALTADYRAMTVSKRASR
jgi:hypothetical protein